jgi:signal transduction histidine kinase
VTTSLAGLVAGLALVVGLVSEHLGRGWDQDAWIPILDLAIGWSMVASGLVAAVARPRQIAGRRLVLAGFLWFVGTPQGGDNIPLGGLAFAFQGYFDLMLVLIALSFTARWPARRSDRAYLAALAAVFVVNTVVRLAARSGGSSALLRSRQDSRSCVGGPRPVSGCRRPAARGPSLVHVVGPARRYLDPVSWAAWPPRPAAATGCGTAVDARRRPTTPGDRDRLRLDIKRGPRPRAIGCSSASSVSRRALAVSGAMAGMVAGPTRGAGSRAATGAGRPSPRILGWDAEAGGYHDEAGDPALPPEVTDTTAVTPILYDGAPLAILVHDPALDDDPALVASGLALTTLVMHNERLGHEVDRQLAEVRASRARIVEAGDEERRRIERDLHDGMQQRLVALGLALRRAAARPAADPDAADALARGADEALAVVEDVRELARGIHPAILSEAGLASGLRALADRSPVPVEVDGRLVREPPPTIAATAYFVVSEALANVAKHAAATTAWIRASDGDGVLRVAVEDDGRGGVDPAGSGLRGLQDRVSALGGTFTAASRPEGGTVVTASIPLT